MPSLSKAEKKSKELLEYVDNPRIQRIIFSISEKAISVVFANEMKVNMYFKEDSRFDKLYLTNGELGKMNMTGLWFTEDDYDTTVLAFIFNVLNRNANSFIFQCEYAINELWSDG